MPRTVLRYAANGASQWGVQFGERIAPPPSTPRARGAARSVQGSGRSRPRKRRSPRDSVRLLSPVTPNQQFICQGVNYRSHVKESGLQRRGLSFNTIFTKAPSCITAADAPVACPRQVELLDYEIELGLVLRRDVPPGSEIRPDGLATWLAGVTIVNDLFCARRPAAAGPVLQGQESAAGPVGPGLVLLEPGGAGRNCICGSR